MKWGAALCLAAGIELPAVAAAQTPPPGEVIATAPANELGAVYVFGKGRAGIGTAVSASQGSVSFAKFADRPLLRPGELVEVVPGLVATQHSGNAKANQYFLRGFNLDHGTDLAVSFDGVPLNLRRSTPTPARASTQMTCAGPPRPSRPEPTTRSIR